MAVRRYALLSVYDKTGVVDLARRLDSLGFTLLSTGGTAEALRAAGLPVTGVSEHTGHPEILGGRVKTLHPRIHGGILADLSQEPHRADLARASIAPIDLVVVNLYPFAQVASRPSAGLEELIEMIDIGGPSMLRSAAKNSARVGVVVDPSDYPVIVEELQEAGALRDATRRRLALKAFTHTAAYDGAIRDELTRRFSAEDSPAAASGEAAPEQFPARVDLKLRRLMTLRYGENPHQAAALYGDEGERRGTIAGARQLQGKELSFNNILDLDAAWRLALEFEAPAAVIVKHNNPCGVAIGETIEEAFAAARRTDPLSAFGGIVASNREIDEAAAAAITSLFLECLIAPGYGRRALAALAAKSKLRVMELPIDPATAFAGYDLRRVTGGLLMQNWDRARTALQDAQVATRRPPTADELQALDFTWRVAKHVKSNAIVLGRRGRTVGIGAGQMSRVDSVRLAVSKAQEPTAGTVLASDAFFPFRDGIDAAAGAGVTAVVQPGGSSRDSEVIAAADERGMAMIMTGTRHFRH
ncbi:MAG TPA: bifunctional phosphoribosylaminoimidazolecarboxamide formyltransferase/IMP cyclohydrolase [Candidatus Polarisedimenticolia bacterium]|nr:bifunctional phosphoribosylaminoimidazolecarboxamide formyltransferase/IMP cyclohydrolase [Candidatus Polarisedimenticolia bacterium]